MGMIKTGPFLFPSWGPTGHFRPPQVINLVGVVLTSVKGQCSANLILRSASEIVNILCLNLFFKIHCFLSIFKTVHAHRDFSNVFKA